MVRTRRLCSNPKSERPFIQIYRSPLFKPLLKRSLRPSSRYLRRRRSDINRLYRLQPVRFKVLLELTLRIGLFLFKEL